MTGESAARPGLLATGPESIPYARALEQQRSLLEARIAARVPDVLLLCEHGPTITLGRGAHAEHLLSRPEDLAIRGVEVFEIERGGDVTWHGPGQLVGYPILDLGPRGRDVHRYLRDLEEVLIRVLAGYGLAGERDPGFTGVWVAGAKVAAIGVKVKRWVTMHGFALNVSCDLQGFRDIVPCGLHGRTVTSMERLLGPACPDLAAVAERLVEEFQAVFGVEAGRVAWADLATV